ENPADVPLVTQLPADRQALLIGDGSAFVVSVRAQGGSQPQERHAHAADVTRLPAQAGGLLEQRQRGRIVAPRQRQSSQAKDGSAQPPWVACLLEQRPALFIARTGG